MTPRPFYEIDTKAYLFEKNERPEEKIRQWVLFELLSTYGININDIRVEVPVKSGSTRIRADIVVLNNHAPMIVIECKEEKEIDLSEAMKQAVSYAESGLGAIFAVATNGHKWIVQRKQYGEWVSVIDLSRPIQNSPTNDLNYLFLLLDGLRPLFFWIYRQVPAHNAQVFFSQLQEYLDLKYDDFSDVNPNLYKLTNSFLKIIAWRNYEKTTGDDYDKEIEFLKEEIMRAYRFAGKFFQEYKVEFEIGDGKSLFSHNLRPEQAIFYLGTKLGELAKQNRDLRNNSAQLLRFTASLSKYLVSVGEEGKYLDVSEGLVNAFFNFVDPYLLQKFNVVIPDRLDEYLSDFYENFESDWQSVLKNDLNTKEI